MGLVPRLRLCILCRTPIPQAKTGRPRLTCGGRCRKRKERRTKPDREWKEKTKRAWQIIRGWERKWGPLTKTYPEWEPLTLRDRLLIRLQRGWHIDFCDGCDRPYLPDAPDATRSGHCTKECQREDKRRRERVKKGQDVADSVTEMRLRLGIKVRRCKHCGIKFTPTNSRHQYHAAKCRVAAHRKRWRKCASCGTRFEPKRADQINCKRRCRENMSRRKAREAWVKSLPPRLCTWCGELIKPEPDKRLRNFCNSICYGKYDHFKRGHSKRLPRKSPLRVGKHEHAYPPLDWRR